MRFKSVRRNKAEGPVRTEYSLYYVHTWTPVAAKLGPPFLENACQESCLELRAQLDNCHPPVLYLVCDQSTFSTFVASQTLDVFHFDACIISILTSALFPSPRNGLVGWATRSLCFGTTTGEARGTAPDKKRWIRSWPGTADRLISRLNSSRSKSSRTCRTRCPACRSSSPCRPSHT
jgi:hypothetical protein